MEFGGQMKHKCRITIESDDVTDKVEFKVEFDPNIDNKIPIDEQPAAYLYGRALFDQIVEAYKPECEFVEPSLEDG